MGIEEPSHAIGGSRTYTVTRKDITWWQSDGRNNLTLSILSRRSRIPTTVSEQTDREKQISIGTIVDRPRKRKDLAREANARPLRERVRPKAKALSCSLRKRLCTVLCGVVVYLVPFALLPTNMLFAQYGADKSDKICLHIANHRAPPASAARLLTKRWGLKSAIQHVTCKPAPWALSGTIVDSIC